MKIIPAIIIILASIVSTILVNFKETEAGIVININENQLTEINYKVSFPEPHTHYCEVEIKVKDFNKDSLVFFMPVWTPGSYLVREFSRNVENVKAKNSNGDSLFAEKINKNSWRINSSGQKEIVFSYRVYCNESSVRTSEINSSHAFLSNAGLFMSVKGFENANCIVEIDLPAQWNKISTGLNKVSENIYSAENYDILIDSPVEIGNQEILEFSIKGVNHFICIYGKGNYDKESLLTDFKKICEEEIKFFKGDIPYDSYTFIIHLVERGGGGLEHLNSFVAQAERWMFSDEKKYKRFLGLVSHEFFHLWNVKRIRPVALGPFDYENENYTKSLWVAEGWTSFYDNLFLRRCGILDNKEYFEFAERELNDAMKFEGRFRQSVEESSFDAWIKFYRKDSNFHNSQISYYTKGAMLAMLLNLEIIKSTNAEKSLDDVMLVLNEDYKKDNSTGYTDERVKELCEFVSGRNLNEFWQRYVNGTDELPVKEYFVYAGLKLINENDDVPVSFDIQTKSDNGRLIISEVYAGGSGYESGLNSGDEIIAVNGIRMNNELIKTILENETPGNEADVLINRRGIIENIKVKLHAPLPKYKIKEEDDSSEEQKMILNKWLTGKAGN